MYSARRAPLVIGAHIGGMYRVSSCFLFFAGACTPKWSPNLEGVTELRFTGLLVILTSYRSTAGLWFCCIGLIFSVRNSSHRITCRRMTIWQRNWRINHGAGMTDVVRELMAKVSHVIELDNDARDVSGRCQCHGTVTVNIIMYVFFLHFWIFTRGQSASQTI